MPLPADYKVAGIVGTGGFNANIYWSTAGDSVPEGSDLMTRIAIISPIRTLTAIDQYIFCKTDGTDGWALYWDNNLEWRFGIDDGGGAWREANFAPTNVPIENELYVVIGSYDETELIVYAKGESNVGGPYVGFTQNARMIQVGQKAAGASLPAPDFIVLACLANDIYALSLAEMATVEASIIDDLEQGRFINIDNFPGDEWIWYWDSRDCNIEVPGQWIDRESGIILNETGQTERFGLSTRF